MPSLTIPMNGGWRLQGYNSSKPDGDATRASNFECVSRSGYRRVDGSSIHPASQPTGSGAIKGITVWGDDVYVAREDGANTRVYKAGFTDTSWTLIKTIGSQGTDPWDWCSGYVGTTPVLFGVNGHSKAFYYDGSTTTDITTGLAVDQPQTCAWYKHRLFVSRVATFGYSNNFDVTTWTIAYPSTIGHRTLPDTITELVAWKDETLLIFTRDGIYRVVGASTSYWDQIDIDVVTEKVGASSRTALPTANGLYFLFENSVYRIDDRSTNNIPRSNYGGLILERVSDPIEQYLYKRLALDDADPAGAWWDFKRNQYKLAFETDIVAGALNTPSEPRWSVQSQNKTITCVSRGENIDSATGEGFFYVGTDDGYVLRIDDQDVRQMVNASGTGVSNYTANLDVLVPSFGEDNPQVNVHEVTADVRIEPRATPTSDPVLTLTGFGASTTMTWDTTSFDLGYSTLASSDNMRWNRCRAQVDSTASKFLLGISETGDEPFVVESITLHYTVVGKGTSV